MKIEVRLKILRATFQTKFRLWNSIKIEIRFTRLQQSFQTNLLQNSLSPLTLENYTHDISNKEVRIFLGIAEIKMSGNAVFRYSISGLSDRLAHFVFYISPSYDGEEQNQFGLIHEIISILQKCSEVFKF